MKPAKIMSKYHNYRQPTINIMNPALMCCCLLAVLLSMLHPNPSVAAQMHGVVATVGSESITDIELEDRIKLHKYIFGESGVSKREILDAMIQDRVIAMKSRLMNVSVTTEEVDEAMYSFLGGGDIDKGKVAADQLESKLASSGSSLASFRNELHSKVLWQKLAEVVIPKKMPIFAHEISEHTATMLRILEQQSGVKPRIQFSDDSEILVEELVFENRDPEKVLEFISAGVNRGDNFNAIAEQIQQAGYQASAEYSSWLRFGDLHEVYRQVLADAVLGGLLPPLSNDKEVVIIKLVDARNITFSSSGIDQDELVRATANYIMQQKNSIAYDQLLHLLIQSVYIERRI